MCSGDDSSQTTSNIIEASKLQQQGKQEEKKHRFNMKLVSLNLFVIVFNGIFGKPQNLDDKNIIDSCSEYASDGFG
jgi:hypothetical protein